MLAGLRVVGRQQQAAGRCQHEQRANTAVLRAAAGKILAAEQFASHFQKHRRRRDPAQLDTVVAVLAAEERLVRQRTGKEVVGMRVMVVEVADVGQEPARTQAETVRLLVVSMNASSTPR